MFTLVSYLCANEIAHNLFVTRGKRFVEPLSHVYDTLRVFVWAREPAFGKYQVIGCILRIVRLTKVFLRSQRGNRLQSSSLRASRTFADQR